MDEVAEDLLKVKFKVRRKQTALALAEEFAEVYRKRFPKAVSVFEASNRGCSDIRALPSSHHREDPLEELAGALVQGGEEENEGGGGFL